MKTEYKVVPAPEKTRKVKGLKGAALFAHAMEELMNDLAADGWQYLRADTLPQEERSGLTTRTTTYRNLLVFQRFTEDKADIQPTLAADLTPPSAHLAKQEEQDDEEVTNLWQPASDDPTEPDDPPAALVADRQRQRMDL